MEKFINLEKIITNVFLSKSYIKKTPEFSGVFYFN